MVSHLIITVTSVQLGDKTRDTTKVYNILITTSHIGQPQCST